MTSRVQRLAVVALLSLSPVVIACRTETAEEVDSETVVSVETTAASLGDMRGMVHATGVVRPAPDGELIVTAPEAGRIVDITRAVGDRVQRGDVLVRFDIPTLTAEVQRQQAEVTRAQATLDTARAAQTRARELFDRGVAARREVEDADRTVADAEAALVQARASSASAEAIASRATVRATFDGIVAERAHNPGDLVEPGSDAVLRVIDPRRIEIVAAVPLADAFRIRVGAPARVVGAPMNSLNVGLTVRSRPAAVEAGTATVPVRLAFTGQVDVPVGTPVQVDVEAEHHVGVVVIPAIAIVREGNDTAAFVAMGGKAIRRPVRIGLTDETHVEVVSGIADGERVIVDGQAGLPDGAAITERGSDPRGTAGAGAESDSRP